MAKNPPGDGIVQAGGILLMTRAGRPEFLLMQHADRWDLPKGHCEPGESTRQAALRETAEETGISADKIELDDRFCFQISYPVSYPRWPDREFTKHVDYYLGFVSTKPTIQVTEHLGYRWWRFQPPHAIQPQTIDPLLAAVADYF